LPLKELVLRADLAVLGTCEETSSSWGPEGKKIFTYTNIAVERCLKGNECADRLTVRQLGGRVDDITMTVVGSPTFHRGERVILFLRRSSDSHYLMLGLSQGKFRVTLNPSTGKSYVQNSRGDLTLIDKGDGSSFVDNELVVDQMELETFIAKLESYLPSR